MNYRLNPSDGFVSVPVYQIWANKNPYGGAKGYFIIKDIRIKETMRDTAGKTTRAYVDVSLMQVPAYQVNTGRDQASAVTAGVKSALISQVDLLNKVSPTAAATSQTDQVKGKKAGPVGPKPASTNKPTAQTSGNGTLGTQVLDATRKAVGRTQP
jgi:hypothetical protein